MNNFFIPKIIFGNSSLEYIGKEAKQMGANKTLIICSNSSKRNGTADRISNYLKLEHIESFVFSDVEPEPSIETARKCGGLAKDFDFLIGIGGGSVLDVCKVASILPTNSGNIEDYLGMNKIPNPGLKKILIPTTSGTGSEITNVSVLINKNNKAVIYSPYLFADLAIIDPLLTHTLPKKLTSFTGMDALSHAIEAYTSLNSNHITDALAFKAIELISKNIEIAVNNPDESSRYNMSLASLLAGSAFINSGCNLNHAIALAIGTEYNLSHGEAVAISLPLAIKYNDESSPKFNDIKKLFIKYSDNLSGSFEKLLNDIGIEKRLKEYLKREDIDELAEKIIGAQRLIKNNPKKIDKNDAIHLLSNIY